MTGSEKGQPSAAAFPLGAKELPISLIAVPRQASKLNEDVVDQLVLSIKRRGLIYPILVIPVPNSDGYLIVVGIHRLEAHRRLGLRTIWANVRSGDPEMVEMDQLEENLFRKELPVLERALQEKRLRDLYIKVHGDTAPGVAGARVRHGGTNDTLSFADLAARQGSGKRTIQRRLKLAEDLCPKAVIALHGTPVANNQSVLIGLSKKPMSEQLGIAKVLACGKTTDVKKAAQQILGLPTMIKAPSVGEVTVPLQTSDQGYSATASLRGRRVHLVVQKGLNAVTFRDLGPADPHRAYPNDQEILTPECWTVCLQQLVDELPPSISKDVQLKEPNFLRLDAAILRVENAVHVKPLNAGTPHTLTLTWDLESVKPVGKDGTLQVGGAFKHITGTLYGGIQIGEFRKQFRGLFSRYILKSSHGTTDAFGVSEQEISPEPAIAKGPRKARPQSKPGVNKAKNSAGYVTSQLRNALRLQGFKPREILFVVDQLAPRIDDGEHLKNLITSAVQILTPQSTSAHFTHRDRLFHSS